MTFVTGHLRPFLTDQTPVRVHTLWPGDGAATLPGVYTTGDSDAESEDLLRLRVEEEVEDRPRGSEQLFIQLTGKRLRD